MKRMSRRTKRMIAIMVAYMIVVVNVISAYANENLEGNTLTYSEEEVMSWEGSSGDTGESSYEALWWKSTRKRKTSSRKALMKSLLQKNRYPKSL